MQIVPPLPLTFVIPGRDRVRWQAFYLWRTQSGRSLAAAFMMIALTGNVVLHPAHDATTATIIRFGFAVLAFVLFARAVAVLRALSRDERCTLTFAEKDITVSRDGKAETVSWYGIKGASAFGSFYAIERRADARHPILIPRAALADAGAFWSYLERRLQGTRPGIRDLGVPAPKRLINRTGQYLIDNLTSEPRP